jgi:hypothetical protein
MFEANTALTMTDAQVESAIGPLNNARKDIERWAAIYLPGVVRDAKGIWRFSQPRGGQGGTCQGHLVITLSGPKGCGKSMLEKVLKPLLPLLPLDTFEIVKE